MKEVTLLLTLLGLILLLKSVHPLHVLYQKDTRSDWRFLYGLNFAFMLAYLSIFVATVFDDNVASLQFAFASVLAGGGVFVYLVARLSQRTVEKIEQNAQHAHYASLHDFLTGLPNRSNFLYKLNDLVSTNSAFALISVDLDKFKQVNDGLGHHQGDLLLKLIAQRITEGLANSATLYRIGGDEFSLLVSQQPSGLVDQVIEAMHQSLSKPFFLLEHNINISASIGVSRFPEDHTQPTELLKLADIAMYESKRTKAKATFYVPELANDAIAKIDVSAQLHQAVNKQQFQLYYQPIMTGGAARVYGAEALIRWQDKHGNFISPDVFIPIAEQINLISHITCWVIERVVTDLPQLIQQGFEGAIHINLSANDFRDDYLIDMMQSLIIKGRIHSQNLVFEVTESAMLEDVNNVKRIMSALGQLGFRFSVDDFGTGFSSLSLLRDLPLHQIKIDRSFVMNIDNQPADYSIVESAVFLSKNLHYSVVAEGVESDLIAKLLTTMQCDYLQGYHFSRPLPLTDFCVFLAQHCQPKNHLQTIHKS